MAVNIRPKPRFLLYVFTAVGTPIVGYLKAKGLIGDLELGLWGAEVTVVTTLSAAKTDLSGAGEDDGGPGMGAGVDPEQPVDVE